MSTPPIFPLNRKNMSLVIKDKVADFMASLPPDHNISSISLQGEPLFLKCAEAGALQCIEALLDREPHNAKALLAERDATGVRALDLLSGHLNAPLARKIVALVGADFLEDKELDITDAALPLTRALNWAKWDAAKVWLEACPHWAKNIAANGRSTLHLVAEPSFEWNNLNRSQDPHAKWPEPPRDLVETLLKLEADPLRANPRGHTPLARAILMPCRNTVDVMLETLSQEDIIKLNQHQDKHQFRLIHEAVWVNDPITLKQLLDHGMDIESPTSYGSTPLQLSIFKNAFECAELLYQSGASLTVADRLESTGPLSLSALHSQDPQKWLQWLQSKQEVPWGRDGLGHSFTELAFEKLDFKTAKDIWAKSPEADRKRASYSLLGVFERAARSPMDSALKMQFLLDLGHLPARINDESKPNSDDSRERDYVFHMGNYQRSVQLGPLWRTSDSDQPEFIFKRSNALSFEQADSAQDSSNALAHSSTKPASTTLAALKANLSAKSSAFDDDDDEDDRYEKKGVRPSLLGYLIGRKANEAFLFLLQWDQGTSYFREADYLVAWQEGLRSNATMALMKPLSERLTAKGIPLWDMASQKLAISQFGPQKAESLGFKMKTAGDYFEEQLTVKSDPQINYLFFRQNGGYLSYSMKEQLPWAQGIASKNPGTLKAALPISMPFAATSCFHTAIGLASSRQVEPLMSWLIDTLPARAAKSDPNSPWGKHPHRALSLWHEQVEWEYEAFKVQYQAKNPSDTLTHQDLDPDELSSDLINILCHQHHFKVATRLIDQGLPAPVSLNKVMQTINQNVVAHTGLGGSPEKLQDLRELVQSIVSRESYKALIPLTPDPTEKDGKYYQPNAILANASDPVIFNLLLDAGAPTGSGPTSVFSHLARTYASRLSPAFAQRIAKLAQEHNPSEGSLDVAAALASVSRSSSGYHDNPRLIEASQAAVDRVVRASQEASESDWEQAFARDACPIEAALKAGNMSMALQFAQKAPGSYQENHSSSWLAHWFLGRSKLIGSLLRLTSKDPGSDPRLGDYQTMGSDLNRSSSDDVFSERQDKQREEHLDTLAKVHLEVDTLKGLGAVFGSHSHLESNLLKSLNEEYHTQEVDSLYAVLWALKQGLHPAALVDVSKMDWQLQERFPKVEGRQVPAIASLLSNRRYENVVARLYVEWENKGLPTTVHIQPELHTVFVDGDDIDFQQGDTPQPEDDEPRHLIEFMTPQARALAEAMLLEQTLQSSKKSDVAQEAAPVSSRRRL